ncbi:flippase [Limosilactobacillus pulli]|uniref:flippase n=1 Tax=Limosilactobacillus pulli TaxID=2991833 RepID=UPI0024B90CCD|nr:flippase [Limosilactobacillus pulli]
MKKKSLGLNAALNGFRNILNVFFPLITFPYVSRVLQAEGIGKYNFANSIISYFLLIAALGISNYSVREGAKLRDDRKKISDFASQVFTINLISTILSYILLLLSLIIFKNLQPYKIAILIFGLQIFFTTIGVEWVYTIFEEYAYITIRSIIFKIISIILLFLLVRKSTDYLNYVGVIVFSSVGSNVLNYLHSKKFCDIKIVFKINWKKHLKPILVIFATGIATQIYLNSDITILGILKNDYIVGIYSVSSKIYGIVKSLVQAMVVVVVPRLSMLLGKGEYKKFRGLLRQVTSALALVTFPSATGLYMLAPQIIILISGKGYLRGVSSLRILCFALVFSVFSWIFAYCILLPAKRERFFLIAAVVSAFFNIGLNFILIPLISENGAALTTCLAEFVMFIIIIFYSKDMLKGVYDSKFLKEFLTYLIGSVIIVTICLVGNILFSYNIAKVIFDVIFSIVTYFGILYFTKNQILLRIIALNRI